MRRSASEVIRELENRIDRLEGRTASKSAHKASLEALKQAEIAGTALFRFLHQINLINASDDSEHTKNLVAQGKKLKKCEELITDAFIKAQKVRTHLEDQHNLHFRSARLEKSAGKVMVEPMVWDEGRRQLMPSGSKENMDIKEVLRFAKDYEWEYDAYKNVVQITTDDDDLNFILVDVEDILKELLP